MKYFNLLKPCFVFFLTLVTDPSFGQTTLKFRNGSGPSGSGPGTTDKVVTLNYGNTSTPYSPSLTVTYNISNQQYTSVEGNADVPGLLFGASGNNRNAPPGSALYYNTLGALGLATNGNFSTNGITPGIDVNNDYAIEMAAILDALLYEAGTNRFPMGTKAIYFADLTLTFNRAVNNPILHLENLGGWWGNTNNGTTGYSVWLQLTTSDVILTRLSGNSPFVINNGTDIRNSITASSNGVVNTNNNIAHGSVQANGNGITTLKFRVYLDGDANDGTKWSNTGLVQSDAFHMGVSMAAYNISGTVFNDANGLTDNTVNGAGTNAGGLYAVLLAPATNEVMSKVPVSSDGTYNFTNIASADYNIAITTEDVIAGSTFPGVKLPEGWIATGENLGSGAGNDGTPDGILTEVRANDNVANANFGIERPPISDDKEETIPIPEDNSIPEGTLTMGVSGSDAEDGTLDNSNKIRITELPANGTMYYNGSAVTAGQEIIGFDPALLSFTDLENGTTETSFKYSFLDAAGKQSDIPATYTIKWDGSLPVTFSAVSAKFVNGILEVSWSTEMEQNNDHFEVQVSKDGVHFETIGAVATKAPNGNSNSTLHYRFSKSASGVIMGSVTLLVAGLALLAINRSSKLLMAVMVILATNIVITSCTRKSSDTVTGNGKLFIKIVQVDKDGKARTSKIAQVIQE